MSPPQQVTSAPTWCCPVPLLAQQQCMQMTLSPPRNAHRPWFPPIPLGVPSQTPFLDPFLLDLKASTGGLSTLELILGSSSFLSTWPLFRILSCGLRLYLCLVSSAQEIFLKFIHRIVCINSFFPPFLFLISTTLYLFIHLLVDIWVVFSLGLL